MQKFQIFLRKFKMVVLILLATILIFIFLLSKIVPMIVNISKLSQDYNNGFKSLADKQKTLRDLQEKTKKANESGEKLIKEFFKPIEQSPDTEAAIADEFGEILAIMKANSIKTRSIQYEYDPQDDNFVRNMANKYNVAKLNLEMVASYRDFENFLKELYKHEHFLDISDIEIVPYGKNRTILVIKFTLKLYAAKD